MSRPILDDQGYLLDPSDWNEDVARELAAGQKLELGPIHWEVLRLMREYYEENRIAPGARLVVAHLVQAHGPEARNLLFELFPYGYPGQACRIAGMRKPRAWSTG